MLMASVRQAAAVGKRQPVAPMVSINLVVQCWLPEMEGMPSPRLPSFNAMTEPTTLGNDWEF